MKIARFCKHWRSRMGKRFAVSVWGATLIGAVSWAGTPPSAKVYALAGAKVSIERLGPFGKRNLLWRSRTQGGKTLKEIGRFDLRRKDLDPQGLYLIEVRGGKLLDADLDGRIDRHPAPNRATLRLVARGSTLKRLPRILVTFTSELLYERVAARLRRLRDPAQVGSLLDREAAKILRKDLDGDGRITAADIALFMPTRDREALWPIYAKQYPKLAAFYQRHRPILPNLSEVLFEIPWQSFGVENIRRIKLLDHERKALLLHDGNLTLYDLHDPGTPHPIFTWQISRDDDAPLRYDADWTEKRIYLLDDMTFRVLRMDREGTELARFESAHPTNGRMDDFALSKDRIFLLVDGGITVVDRPTLKKLSRIDLKLPISGETEAIRVRRDGRLLLVNWGGNWLKAFRVREDRITELSTIREDTDVKDFSFVEKGRKLVLIDSEKGIMLYDLGDPIHPKLLNKLDSVSTSDDAEIRGSGTTVAFHSDSPWADSKVLLFTVAGKRLEAIGEVQLSQGDDGKSDRIVTLENGGRRICLAGGKGIKAIDTTLIDWRLFARSFTLDGEAIDTFVTTADGHAYGIERAANWIAAIDFHDLSQLRETGAYAGESDDDFYSIVAGPRPGMLTLGDQNQGIRLFRIEGSTLIEIPGELMENGVGLVRFVDRHHLLVEDGVGSPDTEALALYRIRWKGKKVSFRRLGRIPLPGIVQIRYDAHRRLAYVATEKEGVVIARVTGKGTIERIGTVDQTANDLRLGNDRLFVASKDGVRIYSHPGRHPRLEAFIPLPETALSLALDARKDRLFVGTMSGLYVYDLQTRHRLARYPVGRISDIHLLPGKNATLISGLAAGVMAIDLSLLED